MRRPRPTTTRAETKIPVPFERLERALEKQGSGPFFNGARYSLVDAAYAPFLQRYYFLDRIKPLGAHREVPAAQGLGGGADRARLRHAFVPGAEFEAMYRENVRRRNIWVSQFIAAPAVAAE